MSETKMGRPMKVDPLRVAGWRQTRGASIAETAKHFGISRKTVTNYCRDFGEAAERARKEWIFQRDLAELNKMDEAVAQMRRRMAAYLSDEGA